MEQNGGIPRIKILDIPLNSTLHLKPALAVYNACG
jgi:hypothetical protein